MVGSGLQMPSPAGRDDDTLSTAVLVDAEGNIIGGLLSDGAGNHISDLLAPSQHKTIAAWWAEITHQALQTGMHSSVALCCGQQHDRFPVTVTVVPIAGRDEFLVSLARDDTRHKALLSVLHTISVASSRDTRDDLLRIVREQVLTLIPATTFYIVLYDEEADKLISTEVVFEGESVEGPELDSRSGLVGWVLANRKSLNIQDIEQADLPVAYVQHSENSLSQSVLMVPLVAQNRCVGVLSVQHNEPGIYSDEDLWLLEAVASQTAVAIRDAALCEETATRLRMLTFLQDFSLQLAGCDHSGDLARVLCQALDSLTRPDEVRVFLRSTVRSNLDVGYRYAATHDPSFDVLNGQTPDPVALMVDRTGDPVIMNRMDDEAHVQVRSDWVPASLAAYPIRRGDQPLGVLVVCYKEPHLFREDERRILMLVARQTAIAVERAQYYQDLAQRFEQVSVLYVLAQQVTGTLDGQSILQLVVYTLKHIFRCRACVVALREPDGNEISIRAATGVKSEWRDTARFKVGEGIAGRVVATGKPVYVSDVHSSALSVIFDPEVRSVIAVPIAYQDRVIGSLNLDSTQPDAFAPEHERILTIAAAQIAAALEIARLYTQEADRAQKLAAANADLQEMERLREELIQNLSHELRTPLTYIKGYGSLLQDKELGPLLPEQVDALGIVLDKSDTIQRLIHDVVMLEQISEETLDFSVVNFHKLLKQVYEAVQVVHSGAGCTFELELDPAEVWVRIDAGRLNQAIDNLINNAVKFTPQGGVVTLQTRLHEGGQVVECSVNDTGIGIPAKQLDRIFDRFYQVRDPARKGIGGSGIGLAIVQKVLKAHRGEIWVESVPGAGSTFTFTLPCLERPPDHD